MAGEAATDEANAEIEDLQIGEIQEGKGKGTFEGHTPLLAVFPPQRLCKSDAVNRRSCILMESSSVRRCRFCISQVDMTAGS